MRLLDRYIANAVAGGVLLTLFVWVHMLFESSILLGKDAMYAVTRMFEGVPLFGKPHPELVSKRK